MPIFGDLMEQEIWGALTLTGAPAFHLTIIKTTSQIDYVRASVTTHSNLKKRLLSGDLGVCPEKDLFSKMAPAMCWLKTNKKEGNHFQKIT